MFPAVNAERLKKEADFHDSVAASLDVSKTLVDETFTSITAIENQHIVAQFGDVSGKRILDYGCGVAEGGIYFAKRGARVWACDVIADELAETRAVAGQGPPPPLADVRRLPRPQRHLAHPAHGL